MYACMSKCPCPQRLKRIACETSSSRQRIASSIVAFTAWFASGAGMIPSIRANSTPAAKTSVWVYARASMRPSSFRWLTSGAMP